MTKNSHSQSNQQASQLEPRASHGPQMFISSAVMGQASTNPTSVTSATANHINALRERRNHSITGPNMQQQIQGNSQSQNGQNTVMFVTP